VKHTLILTILFLSFTLKAEINFFKGSWQEVLKEAQKTSKPIFVDFYATWCGPCKLMSKTTFKDAEVGKYYNDNFISFKVDAEHEETELVNKVGLRAYPTLVYFNPQGVIMLNWVGMLDKEEILQKGQLVRNFEKNKKAFEKNSADEASMLDYLHILKSQNFPQAQDIASNYLSKIPKKDLSGTKYWSTIKDYTADYKTEIFQYIINNPENFADNIKSSEFSEYYKTGIKTLMLDAIQEQDYSKIELHKVYHNKVYKAYDLMKQPEGYYHGLIDMMYYDGIGDDSLFYLSTTQWLDQYNFNNAQSLSEYSIKLAEKLQDPDKIATLSKYTLQSIKLNSNFQTNYAHSFIQYGSGNIAEAIIYGEKAKKQCKDPKVLPYLNEYLQRLNSIQEPTR
jgi:thioredoxin-related protein